MTERFDPTPVLRGLTQFQRSTVSHIMDRFFGDDPTRRFLTADETGLGKSLVAKGVIASMIDRLQDDPAINRIDIVYVCSNADIAEQNLRRLNVTQEEHLPFASRLTLLALHSHRLAGQTPKWTKPVNLISFTPGTSFEKGHRRGKAEERALLYVLLEEILGLDRVSSRQAKVILQFPVQRARTFGYSIDYVLNHIDRRGPLDPTIVAEFSRLAREQGLLTRFEAMTAEVGSRRSLRVDEQEQCGALVSDLRSALARASVSSLEPDLVILDEFQRFRHLLNLELGGPAAELAHHLFDYPDARVLLLSATPYKPFTYSEEGKLGEDHHKDFLDTLRFLASGNDETIDSIRGEFSRLRDRAILGRAGSSVAADVRGQLLQFMTRTERPQTAALDMLDERELPASEVLPEDFVEFAALRRMARYLDAPLLLEYWKSAPYFVNFSEGYKVGELMKRGLKSKSRNVEILRLLEPVRRLSRNDVASSRPLDMGNGRLRALAQDTVGQIWWQLLWMPPSLPYLAPEGPFEKAGPITKRLVFSSWSATPTAVAALLSHEAQRHTADAADANTKTKRGRLDFRMDGSRPGAMSTLALLWPNPALAVVADPLLLSATAPAEPMSSAEALRLAASSLSDFAVEADVWSAAFSAPESVPVEVRADPHRAALALSGGLAGVTQEQDEDPEVEDSASLQSHVDLALTHQVKPDAPRDTSIHDRLSLAEIALHGPGNVVWRAIKRQLRPTDQVSPAGHWYAAATVASGFRSLFNRSDVASLLDLLYPGEVHWRAVLRYSGAGNLQAVMDEYMHHLVADRGVEPMGDDELLRIAGRARDAISMRAANYEAFDPWEPPQTIRFPSRFAIRYGNKRQVEGDTRQPVVRNAFNSPFWPFVLTTTSVGQEGIDLHWWCHSVVHWNTPANPVDFDQREGRVNRYGGHAIRKNLAAKHRSTMLGAAPGDPWKAGFAAATEHQQALGDLSPHWVYPGSAKVERIVTPFPVSSDHERLRRLKDNLALYRLAFGQPRQEDFLDLLRRRGVADAQLADDLYVDLSPPRSGTEERGI